jgi:hypothetical protein
MTHLILNLSDSKKEVLVTDFPFFIGIGKDNAPLHSLCLDDKEAPFNALVSIEESSEEITLNNLNSESTTLFEGANFDKLVISDNGTLSINQIEISIELQKDEVKSVSEIDNPDELIDAISDFLGEEKEDLDQSSPEEDLIALIEKSLSEDDDSDSPLSSQDIDPKKFLDDLDEMLNAIESGSDLGSSFPSPSSAPPPAKKPKKEQNIEVKDEVKASEDPKKPSLDSDNLLESVTPEASEDLEEPPSDLDALLESVDFETVPSLEIDSTKEFCLTFADEEKDLNYLNSLEKQDLFSEESPEEESQTTKDSEEEPAPEVVYNLELSDEEKLAFAGINFSLTEEDDLKKIKDLYNSGKETSYEQPTFTFFAFIFFKFFLSILVIFSAILAFSYSRLLDRNSNDQRHMREVISDLSISLADIKINNKQSDDLVSLSELSKNLQTFLPQGYWKECSVKKFINNSKDSSYNLHFFHSKDLQYFFTIAIPKKSFTQSLLPQPSIYLHSDQFQIRSDFKIEYWESLTKQMSFLDKHLNYKLFDSTRGSHVWSLKSLEGENTKGSFTPPQDIEHISLDSDTLIYNAPRYYKLTLPVTLAAQHSIAQNSSEDSLKALHETLLPLLVFNNIIIYAPEGKQQALSTFYQIKLANPIHQARLGFIDFTPNYTIKDRFLILPKDVSLYTSEKGILPPEELYKLKQVKQKKLQETGLAFLEKTPDYLLTPINVLKEKKALSEKFHKELKALLEQQESIPENVLVEKRKQLSLAIEAHFSRLKDRLNSSISNAYATFKALHPKKSNSLFFKQLVNNKLDPYLSQKLKHSLSLVPKQLIERKNIQKLSNEILTTESLNSLLRILKQAHEIIKEEEFEAPMDRLVIENTIRESSLKKLKIFIFQPSTKIKTSDNFLKDRDVFQDILSYSFLSDEQQRNFFLNEFDQLFSQYSLSLSPSQINELKSINNSIKELAKGNKNILSDAEKSKKLINIQESNSSQISKSLLELPLEQELIAAPLEDQKQSLGKLGLQILIQAKSMPPQHPLRQAQIKQAISLLYEATPYDRNLWQPIIEGRLMLAQSAEINIRKIVNSNLGFTPTPTPLYIKIRSGMFHYIERKRDLSSIEHEYQLKVDQKIFTDEQSEILNKILLNSKSLIQATQSLQSRLNEYEILLNNALQDFETAKESGFIRISSEHYSLVLSKLTLKWIKTRQLTDSMHSFFTPLIQTATAYQNMINKELSSLKSNSPISNKETEALFKEWKKLDFPPLIQSPMASSTENIFNINIDLAR